jgi:hypothetical protein
VFDVPTEIEVLALQSAIGVESPEMVAVETTNGCSSQWFTDGMSS